MSLHSRHPRFTPPSPAVEARVEALLTALTLDEKILLLGGHPAEGRTHDVPRTGLPAFRMADGPVGVHWWTDRSTAYPATLCLAASWDAGLAARTGEALGRDCRARGVHILLAPGVNLYRSPLCGRNFEYYGEDPWLAGRLVSATICGLQDQGVAATVKHFAGNFQEYDRHGISTDADERTLREVYLRQFEMAIREGGAAAVMTAYNLVNGQHCSEHPWLIQQVLKREWGFDGLVMSDWDSCYDAVGQANAGLDLEMPHAKRFTAAQLQAALRDGLVSPATLDDKVRRLLRLAVCFGWLDHPQQDPALPHRDPQTEAVALEVARGGVTLLRNAGPLLPLERPRLRRLAVLGGFAAEGPICGGGSAYTPPHQTLPLLDAIREVAGPGVVVDHHPALDLGRPDRSFAESEFLTPEGQPGLRAEYFNNRDLAGRPALTRVEPRLQQEWYGAKEVAPEVDRWNFSARWTGQIRPAADGEYAFYARAHDAFFRVWLDEEPLLDNGRSGESRIFTTLRPLLAGRSYRLRFEFRQDRGWNATAFGWEPLARAFRDYPAAIAAARQADAVILTAGFTSQLETEGSDRPFGLGDAQERLIRDVTAANPRTALVLYAGGAVDARPWLDGLGALLHAWYPGQEGNRAVAEILFGESEPAGRLPFTWERQPEDRGSHTCYHDSDGDRRVRLADGLFTGYRHFDRTGVPPLFPFGFGLGYTSFTLDGLRLSRDSATPDDPVTATVSVRNTGLRPGWAVVQWYIRPPAGPLPRPDKELRDFAKVHLAPGATAEVEARFDRRTWETFDPDAGAWAVTAGRYEILAGFHAADDFQRAGLAVTT